MTIKLEGLEEVRRRLNRLEPRIQKNIMRGAVANVAAEIKNDARRRVPKATGKLKKNIVSLRRRGRRHEVSASVMIRHEGNRGQTKNAFYWRFVEYGTRFMPARPFIRPAYEEMRARIDSVMANYVRVRIDKEIAKR